jgi:serine/threonine protein kinase
VLVHTFYGTPLYASPELCENKPYDEKTDIWSLGVLLYELAALKCPFQGGSLMALARSICSGTYEPIPFKYSPLVDKVLSKLLRVDPARRPSVNEIFEWFLDETDMAQEAEVKNHELVYDSGHEIKVATQDMENKILKKEALPDTSEIVDNDTDTEKEESDEREAVPSKKDKFAAPLAQRDKSAAYHLDVKQADVDLLTPRVKELVPPRPRTSNSSLPTFNGDVNFVQFFDYFLIIFRFIYLILRDDESLCTA